MNERRQAIRSGRLLKNTVKKMSLKLGDVLILTAPGGCSLRKHVEHLRRVIPDGVIIIAKRDGVEIDDMDTDGVWDNLMYKLMLSGHGDALIDRIVKQFPATVHHAIQKLENEQAKGAR